MSRPTRKQSPVNIPAYLHAALQKIAAERTLAAGGAKVSIRMLIEAAVQQMYGIVEPAPEPEAKKPAAATAAKPAAAPAIVAETDDEKFSRVVAAAFNADDTPAGQARAAEELTGTAAGSFGQRIKLKDLAYHLRSTDSVIGSLAELIVDYEAGGASELAKEVRADA